MKDTIHPSYNACAITCTCGAVYQTRSTRPSMHVEICAACHPFFTGQQKLVDTAGRVEKFRRKYSRTTTSPATSKSASSRTPTPKTR